MIYSDHINNNEVNDGQSAASFPIIGVLAPTSDG